MEVFSGNIVGAIAKELMPITFRLINDKKINDDFF